MSDVDAVRSAASALIKTCLQKLSQQEASRGLRFFGAPASVSVAAANPDPALIARTRVVVLNGVVTVEVLDQIREAWAEVFRSDTPDVIAIADPAPEAAPAGLEPVPGQFIERDGRLQVYRPGR
jgi:hypothetical protein